MKLLWTVSIVAVLVSFSVLGVAQTYSSEVTYRTEVTTGTFTSIRGDTGTVEIRHISSSDSNTDNGVFNQVGHLNDIVGGTLGFTLYLFGQRVDRLLPTTNLFLTTNTEYQCGTACQTPAVENIENENASLDFRGALFPFWADATYDPNVSGVYYQRENVSSPGERVITVEFSRFSLSFTPSDDTISAQVKLYEADGTVEFIYERGADAGNLGTNSVTAAVGISASPDFLSSSGSQYYTYDGTEINANFNQRDVTQQDLFDTGTVLRFTPNEYPLQHIQDLVAIRNVHISRILPALSPHPTRQSVNYEIIRVSGPVGSSPSFDAATRTFSGSFSTVGTYKFRYEVREEIQLPLPDDPTRTSLFQSIFFRVFNVTVIDDDNENEEVTYESSSSGIFIQARLNEPIRQDVRRVPEPDTGNEPFYYTITPTLPAGLTLDPYTGEFVGAPTEELGSTDYTVTITDLDGDDIDYEIDLEVEDPVVRLEPSSVEDIRLRVREPIMEPIRFPVAKGGISPHPYVRTFSPALPEGLVFAPVTQGSETFYELSGVVLGTNQDDTADTPAETLTTYRVEDSNGVPASLTFNLNIDDDVPSYDESFLPPPHVFYSREDIDLELPSASPGSTSVSGLPRTSDVTSVGPNAPAWFVITPDDNRVRKTVPETADHDDSVVFKIIRTATDADGDTATFERTITIIDGRPIAPLVSDLPLTREGVLQVTEDDPILPVQLPRFGYTPGIRNPPPIDSLTLTLTPLPDGLDFSSMTRMLTGTPTEDGTFPVDYTATDDDGDTDTVSFTIIVVVDLVPEIPTVESNYDFFPGVERTLRLPQFIGGDPPLTYSIALTSDSGNDIETLIGGLRFDPQTQIISGTPTATSGYDGVAATSYTYSAEDSDERFAEAPFVEFTITIVEAMPEFANDESIDDIDIIQGTLLETVNLPVVATEGTVRSVYSLTPALPSGLTFHAEQRTLDGTPSVASPRTLYTYTVTDLDGDTDAINFYITVEADTQPQAPSAPQDYTYTPGQRVSTELTDFTLGNTPLVYTLVNESDLPTGLSFTAGSRTIEGVISADSPSDDSFVETTFTYTATDQNGDEESATFTIEVIDDRPVAPTTIGNQSLAVDEMISPIVLDPFTYIPQASSPQLTITLTPAISGLMFTPDTNNRFITITGTPDTVRENMMTYRVTDDTDTAEVNFTISITVDPKPVAPIIPNQVYIPEQMVTLTLDPFTHADGAGVLTHELYRTDDPTEAPATTLIAGLEFDLVNLLVSGMVTATNGDDTVEATSYTFSATDSDDADGGIADTRSTTFTIAVVDVMPDFSDFDAEPIRDLMFIQNFDIGSRQFPLTTGTGTVVYEFEPALPQGLDFNYDTGVLTGAAEMEQLATEYTYTATDSDMDTATLTFSITVEEDSPVTAPPQQRFTVTVGESNDFTLATFDGGNGMLTYALVGTLPSQLEFIPNTRVVTGRVTGTSGDDEDLGLSFTYTATDEVGDMASATFILDVLDPSPVAPTRVQDFEFSPGEEVSETVSAFTGGSGDLTHLQPSPPLPNWLTFNTDDLMLTGTAPADTPGNIDYFEATYTYTATDADLDLGSHSFTVEVTDNHPVAPQVDTITVEAHEVAAPPPLPAFTYIPQTESPQLTYSLAPLPAGLDFDPVSREITGTPSVIKRTVVVYSATDGTDSDRVSFTIIVAGEIAPVAPTVVPLFFIPGQTVNVTLAPFTILDGSALTYKMARADDTDRNPITSLIGGLSFDSNTRVISGTVPSSTGDDSIAATFFVYSSTDSDAIMPDTTSVTFSITINDVRPNFGSETIAHIVSMQGSTLTSMTLPRTNGTGTVSYTITPALPQGLSFNTDSRVLDGTPDTEQAAITYTYTATDSDGDTAALMFTITIRAADGPPVPPPMAPTITGGGYTFPVGEPVNQTLPAFTDGRGILTYSLTDFPVALEEFSFDPDPQVREITGTIPNSSGDDSVAATTFTYTATDEDGVSAMVNFTITVEDTNITAPRVAQVYEFEPGDEVNIILAEFTGGSPPLTYALADTNPDLPDGLEIRSDFRTSRVIFGVPEAASNTPPITYTYTATDSLGAMESTTFTIHITDLLSLSVAMVSAMPVVGANIAWVASQAISNRVELALDGLTEGIDIRTLDGQQLRLNPQQNSRSSSSPTRFGLWYSAASDSLSDTRSTVTWEGTIDSTNLGLDLGFDISESASLVVGILQNASATELTYRNISGEGGFSTLSVDFDATAFYVGLGSSWLDVWFASGSAESTLTDSLTQLAIPTSFSYETIGLTASFEVIDSLRIGAKIESLTSDLSFAAMEDDARFNGMQSDSSQFRTAFVANYKLKLGEKGNGLLIPKFEFGARDLTLGTGISDNVVATVAAVGGSAMETGFGIDYLQRAWGLTLGFDIRSISIENYSSDSMQWQIRWESGNYASGFSFQLTPHSVGETLGGVDSLYSGGYNQYQSLLERQRGGSNTQDTKGLDFEVGYGIVSGYGTVTPYLKTTNYRGSGNSADTLGIRYTTLQGLELTLKAERERTPQTIQILGYPLSFMQQEHAVSLSTRFAF